MTLVLVTVLCLAAAPLALEQLGNLRYVAEKWTRNTFLSGIVTAHAAGDKSAASEGLSVASNAYATRQNSASPDEFRWNGRVAQGRTIEIKGINGDVHAEASNGSEVEVTAIKSGRRSNPKDVEIRVVEHGGGVTICAVYPSQDASNPNECAPGEGGHMNTRDNDVEVQFNVRVPQGVRFSGRTVNGGIETGALGGDVDARTVNGSISVGSAGVARARTVNGSITASLGRADWIGPLEFKTVNGEITLDLPANTNAEVNAETLNGDISTDFPMTILGRISRRRLTGTIGSGGRELTIKTVNGGISLRRAS
jgi:DUF4097 and DUF4098 domain-containing protein YvlB